jgi:hypothetical protein
MKQTLKAAIAAALIVGSAGAARADLTSQGAVGLPLNPTAQIPNAGGIRIQGDYWDLGKPFAGLGSYQQYGLSAAGRVADQWEINGGISRFKSPVGGESKTGGRIGVKYLFTHETDPVGVRIAAGGGYDDATLKNAYGYVVGTKSFGAVKAGMPGITGHLGLRYDRFDDEKGVTNVFGVADDSNKLSVYGGVEIPLTSQGNIQAVGEVQSKNNDMASAAVPYSVSLRYRAATSPLSGSLGYARSGILGEGGWFAQIGWSFDTGNG